MKLRIAEHVAGVWSYHWAEEGKYKSLCDKPVMSSCLTTDRWGEKSEHEYIRYKWCKDCERIRLLRANERA